MPSESGPIVVEATYGVPIAEVWKAITDKDQMRQWFFESIVDFRPEVGFETEFIVEFESQSYPHHWRVAEVVPERRIVYEWRYRGYAGDSTVTWELTEVPGGATLKLTHQGWQTFPQDNPAFSREAGVAGWSYFVQESLKGFLER